MPFEIPDSWEWVKLEDVADIARGGSPRPIKSYLTNNPDGINWIKIGDASGKYINSTKEKIIPEGVKKSRLVKKGDFLLTNSMSFGHPYILNVDGCIHDGWLVIAPFQDTYNKDFLYNLLSSEFAYSQFAQLASGGVVSNLNSDKVAAAFFPLPPISEQKRIVNEVEKWFSIIDEIESDKIYLDVIVSQAKSKILTLAIQGMLVEQCPNDEPAEALLKRINPDCKPCDKSHYENIPQGWCISTLDFIGDSELGKTLDREKNRGNLQPYLCSLNVLWDDFNLQTIKEMRIETNEYERYRIKKGDLLICEGGEVGRTAIWNNNEDIFYQNSLHRVRFTDGLNPYYFMYLFTYLKQIGIIDAYSKGMTIKHFTKTSLRSLPLIIPPINEQKRIVEKIKNLFTLLDEIIRQLK